VNAAGKVMGLARAVTSMRAELLSWFHNVLDEKRNERIIVGNGEHSLLW
jgi:hypothetical protein